jgi:triosephosphate isomerase (TIM)
VGKKKIVAGNWKMNLKVDDAVRLAEEVGQYVDKHMTHAEVILFTPSLFLGYLKEIDEIPGISLGAQNCNAKDYGAYTGEINAEMLASASVRYCLVGHSERRQHFGETNEDCLEKCLSLLAAGITPLLCVGETLEAREKNLHFETIEQQVRAITKKVTKEDLRSIMFAYEPVWAIGTGKTATVEQAEEMHAFIRTILVEDIGDYALDMNILYGGSCNEKNAEGLFSCNNVDGGLIGGASLKADTFNAIIEIAEKLSV